MRARTTGGAPERTDWLMGRDATKHERRIVTGVSSLAAGGLILAYLLDVTELRTQTWSLWHLALALFLAVDVVGGVVANATDAAKRLYHGPLPVGAGSFGRLVHGHLSFTALHVHPILVGLLAPGGAWWWGGLWYLWSLAGVVLVRRSPVTLQRPVGFGVVALGIMVSTTVPAPGGFAWFPAVLLLKLVAAHAVEEPVRTAGNSGDQAAGRPAAV